MRTFVGKSYHLFSENSSTGRSIWVFSLPLFFLLIVDSAMSFIFPIVVEDNVNSGTLMGLIMALSSVVGLFSDFTFPQLLKNKTWRFQLVAAIVLAILFPISLSIGVISTSVYLFILGSAIWGIYWEFMAFSQQSYIIDEDKSGSYSKDWGVLYLIAQVSSIIGPILGSLLISHSLKTTNITLITILTFSLILALIVVGKYSSKKSSARTTGIKETFNLISEVKYWEVLSKTIWPVMIAGITLSTINAFFWTIGGLFGQELFGDSGLNWLIIVLFSGPTILGSVYLTRIIVRKRKKRFSQLFLILGSAFLSMMFLAEGSIPFVLLLIALGSFALSFVGPLNDAVYSDLLDRLKKDRMHLMGMSKANSSIAYIVGPLLAGFLTDRFNYYQTFSLIGAVGLVAGFALIIFTPKKLKLKQRNITEIGNQNQ